MKGRKMKNYTITVMAIKGMEQVQIGEFIETDDSLKFIDIGKVGKFKVLNDDTRIELWIKEEQAKTQGEV